MITAAPTETRDRLLARPILALGGSVISLLGAGLAIISFSTTDGHDFFLFAGFGLIASGALLARRHAAGAWAYLAVFAATLIWSLDSAGLGGSTVSYRITGPIIMLLMLALLAPALLRWTRRRTLGVLTVLIMATITVGDLWSTSDGSPAGLSPSQLHEFPTAGVLQ